MLFDTIRILMLLKRAALVGYVAAAAALMAPLVWACSRPGEPSWNGRRLSEWLDAYDSHNRFDEDHPRYSPLRDEEIGRALDEMRVAALPVLVKWLTPKPNRLKARLNRLLGQQSWVRFRFGERDSQVLAVTGFLAYGAEAQPLLPELLRLSHSPDAQTRMLAYEAAFFARPDKAVFLPLATRALREADPGVRAMATQWLRERFPEEAGEVAGEGGR